jgi:uncharacterized protein (TIGR03067 family)
MSRRIALLLIGLSAAVVVAAPVPKKLKNTDRASILGDWEEPPEKARVWWFKEDGTAGGGDLPTPTRKGLYRLDPNASPKTLDWSTDNGKTWQLGIYSLEDDTLKVNIAKDTKGVRPETLVETEQTYAITATRKKN